MGKKPVLVVMAAGMGSRYGGLKQIDPVGSHGEAILDYSLFDAHEAGFETAVIVITKAIEKDFMETVGARLKKCPMEIRYAFQELDMIPSGCTVPAERTKPWGTSHAVLCAKDAIDGAPFAVINADDYYGKECYQKIFAYLSKAENTQPGDYCMVSYRLGNTVTENGSVARGICEVNADGYLTQVVERTRIEKYPGGIHFTVDNGATWVDVAEDTPVSMNLWGFTPDFLDTIEADFPRFFREDVAKNPAKAEMFLPMSVSKQLQDGKATVRVLRSQDVWYGVTYAADKPVVMAALREKAEQGLYPDGLWR